VTEIFGEVKVAVAADCSLGDQGIEPAELLSDRQLVGIEDQVGVSADDLEAARISVVSSDRGGRPRDWCQ